MSTHPDYEEVETEESLFNGFIFSWETNNIEDTIDIDCVGSFDRAIKFLENNRRRLCLAERTIEGLAKDERIPAPILNLVRAEFKEDLVSIAEYQRRVELMERDAERDPG